MPAGTLERATTGGAAPIWDSLVCNDSADRWLDNSESISDGLLGFSSGPAFFDFENIVWGEFGCASVASSLSSFPHHVCNVVSACSDEQVFSVDARWGVAGVANDHSLRNGSIGEFPSVSVSKVQLPVAPNFSVSVLAACGSCPQDATGCSADCFLKEQLINIHANTLPR